MDSGASHAVAVKSVPEPYSFNISHRLRQLGKRYQNPRRQHRAPAGKLQVLLQYPLHRTLALNYFAEIGGGGVPVVRKMPSEASPRTDKADSASVKRFVKFDSFAMRWK
uniref:Uncharacterized protein n=1 Tax=Candidatus Kentrum sp. TC TaxID=2126339 RepID=A0A450ZEY7_9GAMM|nr:MAG: hypothetical protein BECKTC1821D_GA0114238_11705 [Candidatus Kentron sp. TC]